MPGATIERRGPEDHLSPIEDGWSKLHVASEPSFPGSRPGTAGPEAPHADARNEDDYTIREWVEAPGHTRGMQVVVVETGGRPVVVGGDVAVWSGELDEPHTEGQLRVRALDPELVWLAHQHEPWRPLTPGDPT